MEPYPGQSQDRCALYLVGVRRSLTLWGIPLALTVGGYLLFIRLLDSRLPHGAVEKFVELVF